MRSTSVKHPVGSALPRRHRGFSLIEVLIAVIILAIGLLGVAGVQVVSLQQTNNSFLQTKANLHVQDLAERIRLNGGDAFSTDAILVDDATTLETEVKRSLGDDATVDVALNGSVATITVTWQERVPVSQNSTGTQGRTLSVDATVAPL